MTAKMPGTKENHTTHWRPKKNNAGRLLPGRQSVDLLRRPCTKITSSLSRERSFATQSSRMTPFHQRQPTVYLSHGMHSLHNSQLKPSNWGIISRGRKVSYVQVAPYPLLGPAGIFTQLLRTDSHTGRGIRFPCIPSRPVARATIILRRLAQNSRKRTGYQHPSKLFNILSSVP